MPPSLIQRLPDDIIYELFYIVAEFDPPQIARVQEDGSYVKPGSLGWIRMTHVCRRWRRLGLDMSKLWAGIVCVFPPGVETIARRTRTTPLTLNFHSMASPNEVWDAVERLGIFSRVRSLKRVQSQYLETNFPMRDWSLYLLGHTLPLLRDLELELTTFTDHASRQLTPLDAPALKSLKVNVPFAVTAPSLTSLYIEDSIWKPKLLLDYLRHYPSLIELHVNSVFGDLSRGYQVIPQEALRVAKQMMRAVSIPSDFIVHFPYLRRLTFSPTEVHAIRVLRYLDTPMCTQFLAEDVWERAGLSSVFTQLDHCRVPRHVLTLNDKTYPEWESSLDIWLTADEPYLEHPGDQGQGILLGYKTDDDSNHVPFVLEAIPSPSSITTLALTHGCGACEDWECGGISRGTVLHGEFSRSLERFHNVTTLYIVGQEGNPEFPGILSLTRETKECIFPKLREVVVIANNVASTTWWATLRGALLARKFAGRQVDRVVLRGAGACHAYWRGSQLEQAAEYALVTKGLTGQEAIAAWLKSSEVGLVSLKKSVSVLIDERELELCNCAIHISQGCRPWQDILLKPDP